MEAIHIVLHKPSNQTFFFATKFLPMTNSRNATLKYWPITCYLEKIGKAKSYEWQDGWMGQDQQLQAALGDSFRVLTQYEGLQAAAMGAKAMGLTDAKPNECHSFSAAFETFRKGQGYVNVSEIY